MCGIFGVAVNKTNNALNQEFEKYLMIYLFFYQEERRHRELHLKMIMELCSKSSLSASQLINSKEFISVKNESLKGSHNGLTAIGHSRLVTNGRVSLNANNQPVYLGKLVCIHNGIVTNDESIWNDLDSPLTDLDTEA